MHPNPFIGFYFCEVRQKVTLPVLYLLRLLFGAASFIILLRRHRLLLQFRDLLGNNLKGLRLY